MQIVMPILGIWWTLSLLISLFLVLRVQPPKIAPEDKETLLDEDQSSPLGFKVHSLPDFQVDPHLAQKGVEFLSVQFEFVAAVIMAVGLGAFMVSLAFTQMDENLTNRLQSILSGVNGTLGG